MTTDLDRLLAAEAENAERENLAADPGDAEPTQPNRSAARPYTVRLSYDTIEEIERLAKELDLPASALVRGFVLEGLAAQRRDSVSALIDRLGADLARLRRLV